MGLIASGQWQGPESTQALAAEWDMNPGSVKRIHAEAARRVSAVDDASYVRRRVAVALDEMIEHARDMVKRGDPRALTGFASAARLLCDITGAARTSTSTADGIPVFRVELAHAPPAAPTTPTEGSPAP